MIILHLHMIILVSNVHSHELGNPIIISMLIKADRCVMNLHVQLLSIIKTHKTAREVG